MAGEGLNSLLATLTEPISLRTGSMSEMAMLRQLSEAGGRSAVDAPHENRLLLFEIHGSRTQTVRS